MQALWFDIPEKILEERRQLGHDKKDELWDGVLHMVPPPTWRHQRLSVDLMFAIRPAADRAGLQVWGDGSGIYGPGENWRIPDLTLARPEHLAEETGLHGAELIVEVLSPNDESRQKLPFYASIGVREVWLVTPQSRVVEMFLLEGDHYVTSGDGISAVLGVTLQTIRGPKLRLIDGDSITDV